MSQPFVFVSNLLPPGFPERSKVEAAVRDRLSDARSGPWHVTLRDGDGLTGNDSVTVEIRKGDVAIAFATVNSRDTRGQIVDCLRFFQPQP